MIQDFLGSYLEALEWLPGWCSADAILLFMAYNELIQREGIAGDVLEIGVYQGKSAIGTAALRGPGRTFVAVDLFEGMQEENVSRSGVGQGVEMKQSFLDNLRRFHGETDFVRVIEGSSSSLEPKELGEEFSFCHIDGGHSAAETARDLWLCSRVSMPGGLVALDDYFNVQFPGVCEGAARFMLEQPGALRPIAIGFNKVLFQKPTRALDLNQQFDAAFPDIPRATVDMWEQPTSLFETGLTPFFDLIASRPGRLALRAGIALRASMEPTRDQLRAGAGQTVDLPVRVFNRSSIDLHGGMGLSYHLWSPSGTLVQWDCGARAPFRPPLPPGDERTMNLRVLAPKSAGDYRLELDVVWEGITWFKDKGSETSTVELAVS